MIHLLLNLQSPCLPEWLLANSLPRRAKLLYPFAVSGAALDKGRGYGGGGVPGSSSPPTSPNPRSSKTTMIRRERWEEVAGCKKKKKPSSDSQSQSCGAPQILQQKLHCMLQPRPWYLTVTQGYSCLTCTAFQRLFLEKKVCIHGGRFKAK